MRVFSYSGEDNSETPSQKWSGVPAKVFFFDEYGREESIVSAAFYIALHYDGPPCAWEAIQSFSHMVARAAALPRSSSGGGAAWA